MRLAVVAMLVAGPALWAQRPTTSPSGFGRIMFPGGGPPAQSVQAPGAGRILYPGTSAPVNPTRGRTPYQVGQRPPVTGVLPFPVAFVAPGNAFDNPPVWGGVNYAPQYAQYPQLPVSQASAPPVVIVNQYFGRDAEAPAQAPAAAVVEFAPASAAPSVEMQTIFLIAMKDHTIYAANAYWVDGGTLHYVTTQGTENAVSLDLVDREMSSRLNRERKVGFGLPN